MTKKKKWSSLFPTCTQGTFSDQQTKKHTESEINIGLDLDWTGSGL